MRFNPDFAIDARTETKKAEAVSTKKVQAMLVAWTNFLRKKMSGLLRQIPLSIAKSGFNGCSGMSGFVFPFVQF